jgi:hypothetical protein
VVATRIFFWYSLLHAGNDNLIELLLLLMRQRVCAQHQRGYLLFSLFTVTAWRAAGSNQRPVVVTCWKSRALQGDLWISTLRRRKVSSTSRWTGDSPTPLADYFASLICNAAIVSPDVGRASGGKYAGLLNLPW